MNYRDMWLAAHTDIWHGKTRKTCA